MLVVLCVAAVVLLLRITASPAFLATVPSGADDGSSIQAIATTLAGRLGLALLANRGQGTITLSDRDLTVIAAQENPDPQSFTDVQVRSAAGHLLLSAHSHLGPLPVVVTARLSLRLTGSYPQIGISEIDVGDQVVPGFIPSAVDPRGQGIFDLKALIDKLDISAFGPDCLTIVPQGVELGFHSPTAPPDPSICSAKTTRVELRRGLVGAGPLAAWRNRSLDSS